MVAGPREEFHNVSCKLLTGIKSLLVYLKKIVRLSQIHLERGVKISTQLQGPNDKIDYRCTKG